MASAPSPANVACAFCHRQFAKYTCPACNAPYCALTCFRSPVHAQCSEAFYKKEVEADIRGAPGKSARERARMMETLRRFEEESAARQDDADALPDADGEEDEDGADADDAEDDDALVRRLAHVDLETTSPDALWALLPPTARARFLRAMEDPSSALARDLLADAAATAPPPDPWWAPASPARKPDAISIPEALKGATGAGLVYNVAAVLIAYAYATRHLARSPLASPSTDVGGEGGGTDEEAEAACTLLARLVPFLTERTSTTRHPTLDSALTALRSRLSTDVPLAPLLHDAAVLLRPARVLVLESPASPPASSPSMDADSQSSDPNNEADATTNNAAYAAHLVTRALGDLAALFLERGHRRVAAKLAFYGAALAGAEGEAVARGVAGEMEEMVRELAGAQEGGVGGEIRRLGGELGSGGKDGAVGRRAKGERKVFIEEVHGDGDGYTAGQDG
ncbi:hypothetical protein B0H15DRAFT_147665 [Mycena belliarum]|uniref:HIT-type domain-containing protein n=1 Tax=Mycena belliarum TaxID=1033014 RepID=A0AAD6U991_9AGAR|nr:hypothetical protein B0H15DRAFT_147665 [Mycena belliae]